MSAFPILISDDVGFVGFLTLGANPALGSVSFMQVAILSLKQ